MEVQGSYIGWPHDAANLLHGVQVRTEATMHCEDLLVYDCSDWQAIEAVGESFPQLDIVSSLAFVVKAVDAVNRRALVITSQDKKIFRIFYLVCK